MKKNKTIKNAIKPIAFFSAFLLSIAFLYFSGIHCPFKKFLNIECAGCGMTRAYFSLFKGDIKSAFKYNPLFFTVPLIIFGVLRDGKITGRRIIDIIIFAGLLIGFIILFVLRQI